MCPQASGAGGGGVAVKYAYLDHDSYLVAEHPPIQNQWYVLFDELDVRALVIAIEQDNGENAAKELEMRWTCDGNVYLHTFNADSGQQYYASRSKRESGSGDELEILDVVQTPMLGVLDKRAQHFKVEIRITSALGTVQNLNGWAVIETLEVT
jgi:hypothetical protein